MSQPNRQQQGAPPQGNQGGTGTQMLQPEQATKLLNVLKETLDQAKQASDPQTAQRYYARAEQIKQVLLNYKRQQNAAAARNQAQGQAGMSGGSNPQGAQVPGAANQAGAAGRGGFAGNAQMNTQQRPMGQAPPQSQGQAPVMRQQQPTQSAPGQQMRPGTQGAPGATGVRQGPIPSSQVTPERYQQVRQRIQEVERKIQSLEAAKRADIPPEQRAQIDSQITDWRNKYQQFSKIANIIRGQLVEQARQNSAAQGTAATGLAGASGTPGAATPGLGLQGQNPAASAPNAAATAAAAAAQNAGQRQSATQPNLGAAGSPPANRAGSPGSLSNPVRGSPASVPGAPTPGAATAPGAGSAMATPAPQGALPPGKGSSSSPAPSAKDSGVPGVNLSGIIKPSVPSVPISSTINVKPPVPMTLKPGANNVRPTLTGGGASGLGQIMGTPAVMRMPTYDMATTTTAALTDNGGRVLTKRKLSELINTIGADEGDGRTTIDGDVEELLLDLADEFISSVTTFACRLAKHRKTDSVDVRDVQLHLERNWNIRIPGYATDEIRSMRKWQPSSSYNQKVSGVEIAKAINGNTN